MSFLESAGSILSVDCGPVDCGPVMAVRGAVGRGAGRITLVGAGPGAADLMTLRALRCLGEADVVFHDRLVDPDILRFVRTGAETVAVGKELGSGGWTQPQIDAAIVAAALEGRRVVRLKSGDPSIFGRAVEEITAAVRHGIEVEIVPGVTAASAAAASLCRPLTARGVTDRVVFATATCRPGEAMSDLRDIARPGSTVVFYMAMHRLAELGAELLAAGVAADQPVTVASHVSRAGARSLETTVRKMARDCGAAGIGNPAVILMSLPKTDPAARGAAEGHEARQGAGVTQAGLAAD